MAFIVLFFVKLIDQVLRTNYLLLVKEDRKELATIVIGFQQVIWILITIYIVHDYSILNVLALVGSTMLGTYITMKRKQDKTR